MIESVITGICFCFVAPCVGNVQSAIEHIYPLVNEFRKERSPEDIRTMQAHRSQGAKRKRSVDEFTMDDQMTYDYIELDDDDEEEDFDSDQSHD